MIESALIIRSTISSKLMQKVLFQGFAIAFFGIFSLLLSVIFIPLSEMKMWGWSIFLLSAALMTLGLLPYRRLTKLQMMPDELTLVDEFHFNYTTKGKKILTLPLQSLAQMRYINHPAKYGIAVWIKQNPEAPIIIHHKTKEFEKLRHLGNLNGLADLFFPYFNERAFNELTDWREEEKEENNSL